MKKKNVRNYRKLEKNQQKWVKIDLIHEKDVKKHKKLCKNQEKNRIKLQKINQKSRKNFKN